MKSIVILFSVVLLLVFASGIFALSRFTLSALAEPGTSETYLATKVKHILIRSSSRGPMPPAPSDIKASIEEGEKLFGTECAACHGLDGHKPTDAGRWMYPRSADLISADVQTYSDRELFWIVKNGIRFSGMPAFGNVETDEHIWNLAHFLRTFRSGDGK